MSQKEIYMFLKENKNKHFKLEEINEKFKYGHSSLNRMLRKLTMVYPEIVSQLFYNEKKRCSNVYMYYEGEDKQLPEIIYTKDNPNSEDTKIKPESTNSSSTVEIEINKENQQNTIKVN